MYNYYSQPQTNRELIESLKINWVLNTPAIEKALLKYDRKLFIPTEFAAQSYLDQPIEIGSGQTISQPFTLAFMLELLNVQSGDKILDIGSGSCWSTALLAGLAGEKSQVTGLEIRKSVWKFGSKNLQQFTLNNVRNILAVDGQVGLSKKKFDRILVSAAAQTLSEELVKQLKIGGIMVIPVQHSIFKITKLRSRIELEEYPGFSFVPMLV